MKILGLDIASTTGWCILNDGKLEKYGVITIPPEMNLFQRIKYFENILNQILQDNNPNEVHIEDVILGISGAKTLAYLGRLNGVAITTCYNKVGDNIKLYTPTFWKSHSFPDLHGLSKKAEIQIAVIKHFKLIEDSELDSISKPLKEFIKDDGSYKEELETIKKQVNKKSTTVEDKKILTTRMNELKKIIKLRKKTIDDVYKQVSISLTAKCGLTSDVSDSIGIAFCNS